MQDKFTKDNGFIQLHRQLLDWEWYTDLNTKSLFIHLLLKANHADKTWRGETIKRGSFITSVAMLSSETGLSVKNIRTALSHLEKTKEVARSTTAKNTRITVLNYDKYQTGGKQVANEVANKGQTSGKQVATTNNENNENNNSKKDTNVSKKDFIPEKSKTVKYGTRFNFMAHVDDMLWREEAKRIKPEITDNDIQDQMASFNDYWSAKPGREGLKLDWLATWRNWIRRYKPDIQNKKTNTLNLDW